MSREIFTRANLPESDKYRIRDLEITVERLENRVAHLEELLLNFISQKPEPEFSSIKAEEVVETVKDQFYDSFVAAPILSPKQTFVHDTPAERIHVHENSPTPQPYTHKAAIFDSVIETTPPQMSPRHFPRSPIARLDSHLASIDKYGSQDVPQSPVILQTRELRGRSVYPTSSGISGWKRDEKL